MTRVHDHINCNLFIIIIESCLAICGDWSISKLCEHSASRPDDIRIQFGIQVNERIDSTPTCMYM